MRARVLVGVVTVCLVFFFASVGNAADTNAARAVSLRQKKSDLLAGLQNGICYSGFRHGQHPDRGDGAVNPGEREILEDLQILTRDGNFKMIRLYDCRTNSEVILKLIRENQLRLKVLLGAWLSAEVNNPGCSWLKPLPAETLAANKKLNAAEIQNSIRLANKYRDIVVAVAVGNEALVSWNDHMVPVESVIDYVRQVKKAVRQPVTVCDNYDWWSHHGTALARELDFISVHTYPEWENQDIGEAMPYTIANSRGGAKGDSRPPHRDHRSRLGDDRQGVRRPGERGKAEGILPRPFGLERPDEHHHVFL